MVFGIKRKISENYHKHKGRWYFYPALTGFILYSVVTKGYLLYLVCDTTAGCLRKYQDRPVIERVERTDTNDLETIAVTNKTSEK